MISLILLLIVSCTAQQRLNRLLRNHPELLKNDTIRIVDTLVREESLHDTVFSVKFDTLTFYRDKVKVTLVRVVDTVTMTVLREADTIINRYTVPIQKIQIYETPEPVKHPKPKQLLYIAGLILFSLFLILLALKK